MADVPRKWWKIRHASDSPAGDSSIFSALDWVRYTDIRDRDTLDNFKMEGWFNYMPMFAMDVSGNIVEDLTLMTGKRKCYDSSVSLICFVPGYLTNCACKDDPMHTWIPYEQEFLDKILCQEEFGSDTLNPHCVTCKHGFKAQDVDAVPQEGSVGDLFHCETCGEFLECDSCCLCHHQCTPLHCISVHWCIFFMRETDKAMTIALEYLFLGRCIIGEDQVDVPARTHRQYLSGPPVNATFNSVAYKWHPFSSSNMVWCDIGGSDIHWWQLICTGWYPATTSDPHTCTTFECLDTFHLLNVVANVDIRDYVSSLEQKVDVWGTKWVPDRYKVFGQMFWQ